MSHEKAMMFRQAKSSKRTRTMIAAKDSIDWGSVSIMSRKGAKCVYKKFREVVNKSIKAGKADHPATKVGKMPSCLKGSKSTARSVCTCGVAGCSSDVVGDSGFWGLWLGLSVGLLESARAAIGEATGFM
jgi:hypothetical protein